MPVRKEINTTLLKLKQQQQNTLKLKLLCANHTTAFRGYLLSFSTLTGTGDRCFATSQKVCATHAFS